MVCVLNFLTLSPRNSWEKAQWRSLSEWFLKLLRSYTKRTYVMNTFRNSPDKVAGWGLSNMQQRQHLKSAGDCRRGWTVNWYLKGGKYWQSAAAFRHSSSTRTDVIKKFCLFHIFVIVIDPLECVELLVPKPKPIRHSAAAFLAKQIDLDKHCQKWSHPNQGPCGMVSLMLRSFCIFGHLEAEQNLQLVP